MDVFIFYSVYVEFIHFYVDHIQIICIMYRLTFLPDLAATPLKLLANLLIGAGPVPSDAPFLFHLSISH